MLFLVGYILVSAGESIRAPGPGAGPVVEPESELGEQLRLPGLALRDSMRLYKVLEVFIIDIDDKRLCSIYQLCRPGLDIGDDYQ